MFLTQRHVEGCSGYARHEETNNGLGWVCKVIRCLPGMFFGLHNAYSFAGCIPLVVILLINALYNVQVYK